MKLWVVTDGSGITIHINLLKSKAVEYANRHSHCYVEEWYLEGDLDLINMEATGLNDRLKIISKLAQSERTDIASEIRYNESVEAGLLALQHGWLWDALHKIQMDDEKGLENDHSS